MLAKAVLVRGTLITTSDAHAEDDESVDARLVVVEGNECRNSGVEKTDPVQFKGVF